MPDPVEPGSIGPPRSQQFSGPTSLKQMVAQSQTDFEIDFFSSILQRNPDDIDALRRLGELFSRKGMYALAQQVDLHLATLCPDDCVVQYNLACSLARGGRVREALEALARALEQGYDDFEYLELDSDLDSLRDDPRYFDLIEQFDARAVRPDDATHDPS